MQLRNRKDIKDSKACPTGSGTAFGYSFEARYNYHTPTTIGGIALNNRWQVIGHTDAKIGIPRHRFRRFELEATHLLERNEAEGLRWWFICLADATETCGSLCLETRVVEHKIKYEYSAKPIAYIDAMDLRGDLPDDMTEPDTAAVSGDETGDSYGDSPDGHVTSLGGSNT